MLSQHISLIEKVSVALDCLASGADSAHLFQPEHPAFDEGADSAPKDVSGKTPVVFLNRIRHHVVHRFPVGFGVVDLIFRGRREFQGWHWPPPGFSRHSMGP